MALKKTLLIGAISALSLMSNSANASNVINFSTTFTGDDYVNSFSYNDGNGATVINTTGFAGSQEWGSPTTLTLSLNHSTNYEFIWEVENRSFASGFLADVTLGSNTYSTNASWGYSPDQITWYSVTSYGQNTIAPNYPWINIPDINTSAEWLWDSSNTEFGETLFFKTSITSPVPEPSTYALMLGGLGLIGFMAHRRRKQANV